MRVQLSKKAAKVIDRMDRPTQQRIRVALEGLGKEPPEGDIKLLTGKQGVHRLRVGGWRLLFSHSQDDTILIEKIAPRGQAYKEG